MPLSVTLITFNEEHNIAAALESVRWADEIIVIDAESTDATVSIASRFTEHVIVRKWPGYAAQKQFAAEQARHEWILSIDADERVSPELALEIQEIINNPATPQHGFYISRQNYYLGRAVHHSGWAPDYQLRLYRRQHGHWQGDYVHESVKLNGHIGRLQGRLDHYSIQSLSAHHRRLDRYTTLAAEELRTRAVRVSLLDLLLRPPLALLRSYLLRLGVLDGFAGITIAYFAAYYVFLKYAKAWERQSADPAQ
ncbi:MAG: glycosyltransferase family 2 protein [Acidobacteriota bacterium]